MIDKAENSPKSYENECDHDWHNMADIGWKRCRKCGLAINYEEE